MLIWIIKKNKIQSKIKAKISKMIIQTNKENLNHYYPNFISI